MTKQQWTGVSIIILAIIIGVLGYFMFSHRGIPIKYWFSDPATFQDCTLAGGLILETYPEQCRYRGKSFTNPDQKLDAQIDTNQVAGKYTHPKYSYSFTYPPTWKIAEYHFPNETDVAYVAIDPIKTKTQVEFETLDSVPGMVSFYLTEGEPIGFSSLKETKLNSTITARSISKVNEKNVDNPAWVDTTRKDYYIPIPLQNRIDRNRFIVITIAYPNADEKNVALQKSLNDIIASFSFSDTPTSSQSYSQTNQNTLTYTNSEFGFKMSLPLEYGAYTTTRETGKGPAKNATEIAFYVDSRNTNGDDTFRVFILSAYPRTWWDQNANVDKVTSGASLNDPNAGLGGYLGQYVNKNNSHVFTYSTGHDCPQSIGTDNPYDTFQCDLFYNVDKVTNTLTFTK